MDNNFDDNYTIYLSDEARESLAAYICSSCGSEMLPQENEELLVCRSCGKSKYVKFYDVGIGDELCGGVVVRMLGSGSAGNLYLCEYPDLSRRVVKMLKKSETGNPETVRRFEQEAEIMSKLSHQNIVQLIEFKKTAGALYLVMEYVDGFNLLQMISQEFYFSGETALEMIYCLSDAFKYAWENCHLLHRDIKPTNIMITCDGVLKILDFGLSKQCDIDTGLTSVGQALGSPGYMSPEQFRDSRIYDCRSDIFSLGVTMYFVLSGGKMPYEGNSPLAAYQNMISTVPAALDAVNPDVHPRVSELVMSMLDKEMEKRPFSWQELMNKVEDIANSL